MISEEILKKAKPILFNTEMVRAIQNGTKTVTRRVIKPKFKGVPIEVYNGGIYRDIVLQTVTNNGKPKSYTIRLPYQVGDILYVRETWYYESAWHDLTAGEPDLPSGRYSFRYVYKADSPDYPVDVGVDAYGWKPSIHMPKEAARIFLRVTDVRVERLQEITEEQAKKEGCAAHGGNLARDEFEEVWHRTLKTTERILYGWDANPWVTVNEFRRISKEEALNESI